MINVKNVVPGEGCSWHEVSMMGDITVRRVVVRDPANGEFACLLANEKNGRTIQQFRMIPKGATDFAVKFAKGRGGPDQRLTDMARELSAEWRE